MSGGANSLSLDAASSLRVAYVRRHIIEGERITELAQLGFRILTSPSWATDATSSPVRE